MNRAGFCSQAEADELAVVDDLIDGELAPSASTTLQPAESAQSSFTKTRSLSDGGGTPVKLLSPSPHIIETGRRTSKDDNYIRDSVPSACATPVTPCRVSFPGRGRGLSLHVPSPREASSPAQSSSALFSKPAPLSPKLDHSQTYASPTNILPRRSRGLDFSRAATSLHHSTLAEQDRSPESSPTISSGRAMNIPNRRSHDYGHGNGHPELSSTSLWSMMGNQERMNISSSLGSSHPIVSDSSDSSDDDLMDQDMDDAFVTTPHVARTSSTVLGAPSAPGSPALNSLSSFQQRQRPRKQPKKKNRGPLGLGFGSASPAAISKSPPVAKDIPMAHSRRESISWQANQLHISGSEEERSGNGAGTPTHGKQRHTIMRQVATRRGNLMPKTKNFARIKHALLEEGAPVEAEVRREAEVIRQVRESDVDLEPRIPTAHSSPSLANLDNVDDVPLEEGMMADAFGSFKHHVLKNSKGPKFWDTFSESSSIGTRTTPPPPAFAPLGRGSSSGVSEDVNMDSPSLGPAAGFAMAASSGGDFVKGGSGGIDAPVSQPGGSTSYNASQAQQGVGPSAAEITRRINSKRRRDEDFDPMGFKRRAVSPGMSVHNSPIMQSPLQRDMAPWGSRPGSNGGDRGGSGAPSENGSGSVGGGTPATGGGGATSRVGGGKGRVGFQGMVDTHDGLMRMSIE